MGPLTPYLAIGALVFALSLGGAGYWKGHNDGTASGQLKIDKLEADAKEASQHEAQLRLIQSSNASTGFENDNAKAKVVFRTIHDQVERIVDRPVFRNVCLDDDGLRLANAALSGIATTAPTSEPNTGMPKIITSQ